jgi:hypothetical protein
MPAKEKAEKVSKKAKAGGEGKKRALSPYIIFCSKNREKVKAANPGATFGELGKLLGALWANLDEKGRAVSVALQKFEFHNIDLVCGIVALR